MSASQVYRTAPADSSKRLSTAVERVASMPSGGVDMQADESVSEGPIATPSVTGPGELCGGQAVLPSVDMM